MQARATRAAGKAQEIETQIAAKSEGDAARQREIQRKKNLLRAISSQTASAAAAGVSLEGSPMSLINLDIAESKEDYDIDSVNTKTRQRALRFQGSNARTGANAAANASLLDTAGRTAGMFF